MLKFNHILGDSLLEVISNSKFDYRKGNYSDLAKFISASDWVALFNFQSVQCMYDTFILKLNNGCNRFVPVIDMSLKSLKPAPWLNAQLKDLIRKKKDLRYKNCATKWKVADLVSEYNSCCGRVVKETWKARRNFEKEIVKEAKTNPRVLFRNVNSQKKIKCSIKAMKRKDGSISNDSVEICELLNEQFQSVFVNEGADELPDFGWRNGGNSLDMSECTTNLLD